MKEPEFLLFASEAQLLALWGAGFIVLAIFAWAAEKWRNRREPLKRIEKVGWVPWTTLFMACMIIGGGLLAMSLPKALFGG
jgi:hypothetical protein